LIINKWIKAIMIFTVFALFAGIASAQDTTPPFPVSLQGTVTIGGNPAPPGTAITAKVGATLAGSTVVQTAGVYGETPKNLLPVSANDGDTVGIYVNNVQVATFTYHSSDVGKIFQVALNAPAPPRGGGGPSGGGGGGGGVISSENFANIQKSESRDIDVAIGHMVCTFRTLDTVKEIGFDAKTNEGLITCRVEELKGRPSIATSDAPGTVYKYFNVLLDGSTYGSSTKIENTYVIFSVPNAESVKLMKLINGEWTDLKTEKIDTDTYKAETLGFSSFAIIVSKAIVPTATPTLGATVTPAVTSVLPVTAPPINYAIIIGVIVLIAIVVVLYLRRKKP
jgi:PGF-pre-PGF domain-containing protein